MGGTFCFYEYEIISLLQQEKPLKEQDKEVGVEELKRDVSYIGDVMQGVDLMISLCMIRDKLNELIRSHNALLKQYRIEEKAGE